MGFCLKIEPFLLHSQISHFFFFFSQIGKTPIFFVLCLLLQQYLIYNPNIYALHSRNMYLTNPFGLCEFAFSLAIELRWWGINWEKGITVIDRGYLWCSVWDFVVFMMGQLGLMALGPWEVRWNDAGSRELWRWVAPSDCVIFFVLEFQKSPTSHNSQPITHLS